MSLSKSVHTSFSDAIEQGDIQSVTRLVDQHPELVNHPEWTPPPIHCAILWNQPEIVEFLLDCGVNIETLDPDRQTTPLRYAIMYCKTDVIPVLLARGTNSGPIVADGSSALQLAKDGASGMFEEFDDLPASDEYGNVIELLEQYGITE